ncbi:alpha/beta hydrolase [Paucibacter sp. PLA-PC-4]|uniref:alpha/beta fold hydrolase n=1 Tax=Paucibacter sp. PLA-PC-4 TaxID=2993655 RepID=UPI00224945EB|nr:alpha/beta hydrolase [Paucibacter sp. PLA-PC-4]MCX2863051.1 alpha/beta hydrolase [Paucibacter sp. PLA-PC-4]
MIETFELPLPHGITLSCRACGPRDAPRLVFLHGFPEAAFVWDELMQMLSPRFRCIAPNLRGYERSSSPAEVEAYRAKHLMADIKALIAATGSAAQPLAALVAHDWGGAVAWNLAVQAPALMHQLIIINSPHPGTFLRELQLNAAQREASAYMNWLCRPDAEALLAADDYARMWPFFTEMGGAAWLSDALRQRYREVWDQGLSGPLNYYRASPMRPPTPEDPGAMALSFAPEFVTVRLPTLVIWGEEDRALPPGMLDGLAQFVPLLQLQRVAGAGHWIVHERPALLAEAILRVCR